MYQTVHAGEDLHKGAEVCDAHNFAGVDVPDHSAFAECGDAFVGDLSAHAIGGGDVDSAVFLHVDGRAGLFLQGADVLASRADQGADLIDRDLDGDDARRMRLQLGSRGSQCFQHPVQDGHACHPGLLKRFLHDLRA